MQMSFDEISFINEVFKRSIDGDITWSLSYDIPRIIYENSEITLTSCYQSSHSSNGSALYIYRYRIPEYYGEHDGFYNIEKIRLTMIKYGQISWQSNSDTAALYNLFDYISSQYSGIGDFFS